MAKDEFVKKHWGKMAIGGLLLLGLLYYLIRASGKAAGELGKAKHIKIPKDIFGIKPKGDTSKDGNNDNYASRTISGNQIRQISTAMHDDMSGFNWAGHDMTPYETWSTASDAGFVAVYNDFNDQYFSEGEGTLKEWLDDESFGSGFALMKKTIYPRMASLNLM